MFSSINKFSNYRYKRETANILWNFHVSDFSKTFKYRFVHLGGDEVNTSKCNNFNNIYVVLHLQLSSSSSTTSIIYEYILVFYWSDEIAECFFKYIEEGSCSLLSEIKMILSQCFSWWWSLCLQLRFFLWGWISKIYIKKGNFY